MRNRPRRAPAPRVTAPSEHDEQAALFRWAALHARYRPELHLLFAVPNGGARDAHAAAKMKTEGVRPGVPDVCLPVARTGVDGRAYGALWIEMKRPPAAGLFGTRRAGSLSPLQRGWLHALASEGQAVAVCYGFEDARRTLLAYLEGRHDGDALYAAMPATPSTGGDG